MKVEIRNMDIRGITDLLKDLIDAGFEEENIKLIVPPKDYSALAQELECKPSEIEAGTKKLKIRGCSVDIEARE